MKGKIKAPVAPGLRLSKASLIKIEGMNGGAEVLCLCGSLHVTEEGSLEDAFLNPGETYVIDHRGIFLIQALEDSRIGIEDTNRPCLLHLRWSQKTSSAGKRNVT